MDELNPFKLPPAILAVSQSLMDAIEESTEASQAALCGARADGFVLALETAEMLDAEQLETLYVAFDETTRARVSELGGGDHVGNG